MEENVSNFHMSAIMKSHLVYPKLQNLVPYQRVELEVSLYIDLCVLPDMQLTKITWRLPQ